METQLTKSQVEALAFGLLSEYLTGKGCTATLDKLREHNIVEESAPQLKRLAFSQNSTAMEALVDFIKEGDSTSKKQGIKAKDKSESQVESTNTSTEVHFSSKEKNALKRAVKLFPSSLPKNERWTMIADSVGRNKRECYECYKLLVERSKKKKEAEKKARKVIDDVNNNEPNEPVMTLPVYNDEPPKGNMFRTSAPEVSETKVKRSSLFDDDDDETNDVGESKTESKMDHIEEHMEHMGISENDFQRPPSRQRPGSSGLFGGSQLGSNNSSSSFPASLKIPEFGASKKINARSDMILEECDDFSTDFSSGSGLGGSNGFGAAPVSMGGVSPLNLNQGIILQSLLYRNESGRKMMTFNDAWLKQGFHFNTSNDELRFGLIQNNGGPCGVIASVQATLIDFLQKAHPADMSWTNASDKQRKTALLDSLTEIIWRCSEDGTAKLACRMVTQSFQRGGTFSNDGLTEYIGTSHFTSKQELKNAIMGRLGDFSSPNGFGACLLVYSCILTRGIEIVKSDFDAALQPSMIVDHHYASQELVNLLLTGRAVSNVFDGNTILSGDRMEDRLKLKGISKQNDIGFLTLFEHYGSMAVGENFKTPSKPIWVICSESHYSVCCGQSSVTSAKSDSLPVELFYYDPLGQQEETIAWSLSRSSSLTPCELGSCGDCGCVMPPLDFVLRTKWKNAKVDWNGVEPLL